VRFEFVFQVWCSPLRRPWAASSWRTARASFRGWRCRSTRWCGTEQPTSGTARRPRTAGVRLEGPTRMARVTNEPPCGCRNGARLAVFRAEPFRVRTGAAGGETNPTWAESSAAAPCRWPGGGRRTGFPEPNGTFATEIPLDLGDARTQGSWGRSRELLKRERGDALRASANWRTLVESVRVTGSASPRRAVPSSQGDQGEWRGSAACSGDGGSPRGLRRGRGEGEEPRACPAGAARGEAPLPSESRPHQFRSGHGRLAVPPPQQETSSAHAGFPCRRRVQRWRSRLLYPLLQERLREDHPPENQHHPLQPGPSGGRHRRRRPGDEAAGGHRAQPGDGVREVPPLCPVLHRHHWPLHQRGAPEGHSGDGADAEGGDGADGGGRAGPGQRHRQAAAPEAGPALLPERRGLWHFAAETRIRCPVLENPDHRFRFCHLRHPLLPPTEAIPASAREVAPQADAGGVSAGPGAPGAPDERRERGDAQKSLRRLLDQRQILRLPGVRARLLLHRVLLGAAQAQEVPDLQAGHRQGGSLVQQLNPGRGGEPWALKPPRAKGFAALAAWVVGFGEGEGAWVSRVLRLGRRARSYSCRRLAPRSGGFRGRRGALAPGAAGTGSFRLCLRRESGTRRGLRSWKTWLIKTLWEQKKRCVMASWRLQG